MWSFSIALADAAECGFEITSHPPYSLDLAPSDYNLFSIYHLKLISDSDTERDNWVRALMWLNWIFFKWERRSTRRAKNRMSADPLIYHKIHMRFFFPISQKWQLHLVRDHERCPNAKLHLPSTTGVSTGANHLATYALVYHKIHMRVINFFMKQQDN